MLNNEANGGYFCGCPDYDNDCVDANGESLILVIQLIVYETFITCTAAIN